MTGNLETGSGSQPLKAEIKDLNLGIKQPLLSHQPLGQKLISPKFLLPLGAKSLSNFDPSVFFNQDSIDYNILDKSFQNSPFLSEYQSQQKLAISNTLGSDLQTKSVAKNTIIQPKLQNNNSVDNRKFFSDTDVVVSSANQKEIIADSINTNADLTVIQAQIESHDYSSHQPKVTEINNLSIVSSQPATSNITSTNTDTESTIIQSKLESYDSVSPQPTRETDNVSTISSQQTTSSITPTTTNTESTIIQPKLKSYTSVSTQEASKEVTQLLPSSTQEASTSSTTSTTTDVKSTVIQPQRESHYSITPQIAVVKANHALTSSTPEATYNNNFLRVFTPTAIDADSAIIQPKLENHDSISPQQARETNNTSTPSSQQTTSSITPTTDTESTIIQPKLENHDSISPQQARETNNTSTPSSQQTTSSITPTTDTESTIIQPKLESHDSVTPQQVRDTNDTSTPSSQQTTSSITPTITSADSAIIQPKLESNNSVFTENAMSHDKPLHVYTSPATPTTIDTHSAIIQPQLESKNAVVPEIVTEVTQPLIESNQQALAPNNIDTNSTIIQPQLESHHSVVPGSTTEVTQPLIASNQPALASTTTDTNSTIIQPQLESKNAVFSESATEVTQPQIASNQQALASTTTDTNSTIIQPQLESKNAVFPESATDVTQPQIASNQPALASTTTDTNSTIIQPKQESPHSVFSGSGTEVTQPLIESNQPAIASTNIDTNSTIIQPQLESKNAVFSGSATEVTQPQLESNKSFNFQEPAAKNDNVPTVSSLQATSGIILSSSVAESTILQPQLESQNSVFTQESTTEVTHHEASVSPVKRTNTGVESTVIQPKLESHDSVFQVSAHTQTVSTHEANLPPATPTTLGVESTGIQPKLESNNSVSSQEIVAEINSLPTTSAESIISQSKLESKNSVFTQETATEFTQPLTSSAQKAISNDKLPHVYVSPETSTTTDVKSTLIQPQPESPNFEVHTPDVREINHAESAITQEDSTFPATNPTDTSDIESTIIQPQLELDGNNSIISQKIDSVPNKSANVVSIPSITPIITVEESTSHQQILENPVSLPSLETTNNIQHKLKDDRLNPIIKEVQEIYPENFHSIPTIKEISSSLEQNTAVNLSNKSGIPISENSIIQAEKEQQNSNQKTHIPQLPKALKKISIFNNIAQSSNFISSSIADEADLLNTTHPLPISPISPQHLQKAAELHLPDSWSSIAELVGENKADLNIPTTLVQTLTDNRQSKNKLKPLASTQSQYKQPLNKPYPQTYSEVIQPYTSSESSHLPEAIEDVDNGSLTNEDSGAKDELENLDTLAREVYKMLKQRLEIERERRGNNYSGRLPW